MADKNRVLAGFGGLTSILLSVVPFFAADCDLKSMYFSDFCRHLKALAEVTSASGQTISDPCNHFVKDNCTGVIMTIDDDLRHQDVKRKIKIFSNASLGILGLRNKEAHQIAELVNSTCDTMTRLNPSATTYNVIILTPVYLMPTVKQTSVQLKMQSDRVTFNKAAKKSRKQETILRDNSSFTSYWNYLCFDPQQRLENDGMPVPANQSILFNHCKTNQNLACMSEFSFRTPFGREYEVAAHTFVDSHRAEMPANHWVILTRVIEDAAQAHEQERERMVKASTQLETFDEPPSGGVHAFHEIPEGSDPPAPQ